MVLYVQENARAGKNFVSGICEVKIMTNFERMKQMSVEEMASYFCIGGLPICPLHAPHCKDGKCPECFKKWLESEVNKE